MHNNLSYLKQKFPEIPVKYLDWYKDAWASRYFDYFTLETQAKHITHSFLLTNENVFEISLSYEVNSGVNLTLYTFNYSGLFMAISGVLASMGLDIKKGELFTSKTENLDIKKRYVIDHFQGSVSTFLSEANWKANLIERLKIIFELLKEGSLNDVLKQVNTWVAQRLWELKQQNQLPVLYPVSIEINNKDKTFTKLIIKSQDTPLFLYSLVLGLTLGGVNIEYLLINTSGKQVLDKFGLLNEKNEKIEDPILIDQLKLSVIVTKQFTYFLDRSADPYQSLSRFVELLTNIYKRKEQGRFIKFLSSPKVMRSMAKVLGASDYLWEDFIRLQYESLMPLIKTKKEKNVSKVNAKLFQKKLRSSLLKCKTIDEQKKALNKFKDSQLYLIDLNQILGAVDFREFSILLTRLAEVIIKNAYKIAYDELVKEHGIPSSVAGVKSEFSILGLGKLGGEALGYASDIELMFVFSDNGQTNGSKSISNFEFYELLVKSINNLITTKRDGIFQLDLRLRPHGKDGPLAVSLERFSSYYGNSFDVEVLERLALVRMRAIGGDILLGKRLERLRDEFIYSTQRMLVKDLWDLRKKQYAVKSDVSYLNAKFSPGALVDIEYAVQALQVTYASEYVDLRTPSIHRALQVLKDVEKVTVTDYELLLKAYEFFRRLINGLRMLRGSAQDLLIPKKESIEYDHLARRIGYVSESGLAPSQELHADFDVLTAGVRFFIEDHFSRESLPDMTIGNIADLILSEGIHEKLISSILTRFNFKDTYRAYQNLRRISDFSKNKQQFARLAVLAFDWLSLKSDPDRTLNNWERFVTKLKDKDVYFTTMFDQPKRMDILFDIFSVSQFLSDLVVNEPDYLVSVFNSQYLDQPKHRVIYYDDLTSLKIKSVNQLKKIIIYQKQELLRIAIRDVSLQKPFLSIIHELSDLADTLISFVIELLWKDVYSDVIDLAILKDNFCIFSLGKLGGGELNYSSDIDLIAVYDDKKLESLGVPVDEAKMIYKKIIENLRYTMTQVTERGFLYRVDLNLRPYGRSGEIISSLTSFLDYYHNHASIWEHQALLKIRPVTGDLWLGFNVLDQLRDCISNHYSAQKFIRNIKHLRTKAVHIGRLKMFKTIDVKSGEGGIRDIEFLVQGLQMSYLREHKDLYCSNTLHSLQRLLYKHYLPSDVVTDLRRYYIFLRRIEHFLQLLEDRQTHSLPVDEHELLGLARRIGGNEMTTKELMEEVERTLKTVRSIFNAYLKVS